MDKHITEVSHTKRHQLILEAWEGYREQEGLPDEAEYFMLFLEMMGFFIGVTVMLDDEADLWERVHDLRNIHRNNGRVINGI